MNWKRVVLKMRFLASLLALAPPPPAPHNQTWSNVIWMRCHCNTQEKECRIWKYLGNASINDHHLGSTLMFMHRHTQSCVRMWEWERDRQTKICQEYGAGMKCDSCQTNENVLFNFPIKVCSSSSSVGSTMILLSFTHAYNSCEMCLRSRFYC